MRNEKGPLFPVAIYSLTEVTKRIKYKPQRAQRTQIDIENQDLITAKNAKNAEKKMKIISKIKYSLPSLRTLR